MPWQHNSTKDKLIDLLSSIIINKRSVWLVDLIVYVTPLGIKLSMLVRIETHQIRHGMKTTIQVRLRKPVYSA